MAQSPDVKPIKTMEEKGEVVPWIQSNEIQLPDQRGTDLTRKLRRKLQAPRDEPIACPI
jgi:hypothetical protein